MIKEYILTVILFLAPFSVVSQINIKGFVKDSLQNPLSYTNIIAKPNESAKNMRFVITDEKGYYSLELQKDTGYTITVNHMGYEPATYEFTVTKNTTKNFNLKEAKNRLDEVVIELPVMIKEDTISYNPKNFTNGKERKLKNILKKLPGMEVGKNGQVTVMGKKVTTLLVDNKPFFGGNTKLGVENIPADAVDKIEAIDNYNEVAFLKNVSNSDKMALNIQLKEDKKRFMFGDIEAGKGNKSYYKTHGNLFYYAPKTNVNFIGNLNNIGEKTFTFKDYLNFQGGVNAVFSGNFNFKGGNFKQFLENNDILSSKHRFGAFNISRVISSTFDASGYVIVSNNNTNSFETSQNQYTLFNEEKETSINSKNTLTIGNITLDYTPNNDEQWYFKTQVKQANHTKNNSVFSKINKNINTIKTDGNSESTYINQNIEWHQKSSNTHTFSALADYTFDINKPTTFWQTTQPILQGLIPVNTSQSNLQLQQNKQTEQHYFNTTFKHYWVLNRNNHIYPTIGNIYQTQRFSTNDFQILDDASHNNFSSNGFRNQLNYTFHDFFVGLHYKFRTGIFTFKQGAILHRYHWNVNQQNIVDKTQWNILPDFETKIEFNKSKTIKVNYALKTNFADASKLASRFYLQSYSSVFKGNENLENELYHTARISYNRFSLYRGLTLFANARYTKQIKGYRNSVDFQGVNRFVTYQLINNPSENIDANFSIRKKIKNIRYNLKGGFDFSEFKQQINNLYNTNTRTNYSYEIGAETLFDKFPFINVGFKQAIGSYDANNTTSIFITNEPFLNIEYDFLKDFKFNFEYTRYSYQNKTQNLKDTYQIANASLLYQKEDSPFTFKLYGNNLFNTTFKQSNSFSDYLISDTKTYVMPRVVMFSIAYKL